MVNNRNPPAINRQSSKGQFGLEYGRISNNDINVTARPHRGTKLGRHKPQREHERSHHQPKADPVFNQFGLVVQHAQRPEKWRRSN